MPDGQSHWPDKNNRFDIVVRYRIFIVDCKATDYVADCTNNAAFLNQIENIIRSIFNLKKQYLM